MIAQFGGPIAHGVSSSAVPLQFPVADSRDSSFERERVRSCNHTPLLKSRMERMRGEMSTGTLTRRPFPTLPSNRWMSLGNEGGCRALTARVHPTPKSGGVADPYCARRASTLSCRAATKNPECALREQAGQPCRTASHLLVCAVREHKGMTAALVTLLRPIYFPNAFFSSGSSSPFFSIGSRTSVSP